MTCGLAQVALAPAKVFQDSTKTVNSCSRLVTSQHPCWESVFVQNFQVDLMTCFAFNTMQICS